MQVTAPRCNKVVMVETEKYWLVGSRFSRSVVAFDTVPCPREDEEGYIKGLVREGMLCLSHQVTQIRILGQTYIIM